MNIIKSKKQMYLVIGIFTLILLLGGTTYAFFNYTRTGGANTVSTGRISFNTSYPNGVIALNNVFPITSQEAQTDTTNAKTMTINITGDTDYSEGMEYLVTLTDVHTTVNGKDIPIALEITPTNLGTGETNDYYTAHTSYTTTNMYKVLYEGNLEDNSRILAGYIKPNNPVGTANGVNGSLTIKAYIDASRILITDTLVGTEPTTTPTPDYVNGTTNPDNKIVFTTEEWNSITGNGALSFRVKVESNEGKWIQAPKVTITYNANGGTVSVGSKQIARTSSTYGELATPTPPVGTVLGTVKSFDGWFTEASGGTKVEASTAYTDGTSATTLYAHWSEPYFTYTTNTYYYGSYNGEGGATSLSKLITDNVTTSHNYTDITDASGKDYFIAFTETQDHKIDRAFACGIFNSENANLSANNGTPFCVEGAISDAKGGNSATRSAVFTANTNLLNNLTTGLWQGGCSDDGSLVYCSGEVNAFANLAGNVGVNFGFGTCYVYHSGKLYCAGS